MSAPNEVPHPTAAYAEPDAKTCAEKRPTSPICDGEYHALSRWLSVKNVSSPQSVASTHSKHTAHCSDSVSHTHSTHVHSVPTQIPIAYQTHASSAATAADFGVSTIRLLVRLTMLVMVVFPASVFVLYRMQTHRANEPARQLQSFALKEAIDNRVHDVEDLPVSGLKLYAQATCVKGPSVARVKQALHAQLQDMPSGARERIIESSVIEGMDTVSTRQDTSAEIENDGTAFSYLAYWNTKYNGGRVMLSDRYSTCIMVAGVNMKVAEDVAAYETSSRKVRIGTKPCHCNMMWCVSRCDEYDTVITKKPIFKRHRLTLKNQSHLHRWMVKQAVSHVEKLVATRELLSNTGNALLRSEENDAALSWQAPQKDYFLGKDKAEQNSEQPKEEL